MATILQRQRHLRSLVGAIDITNVFGGLDLEISRICRDSRTVEPKSLFVAIPGTRDDGGRHVAEAIAKGAVAVIAEEHQTAPSNIAQIQVPDARRALAVLADSYFGQPTQALRVVGITGTNGKTTTTHILRDIFTAHGWRTAIQGTLGQKTDVAAAYTPSLTTPDGLDTQAFAAQFVEAGGEALVLEASSIGIDQHRVDAVAFDVCAFSNLAQDHLDYHGTIEACFEAKKQLFTGPLAQSKKTKRFAVINVDQAYGQRLASEIEGSSAIAVVRCGFLLQKDMQFRAESLSHAPCVFTVVEKNKKSTTYASKLHGSFNAENVLLAVAIARTMGIPSDAIQRGLDAFAGVPGRVEAVKNPRDIAIFVDFAHTPDGLEKLLQSFAGHGGRKFVIFGCGGDRDRGKRPLMGAVATRLFDYAVLTSDNPRSEDPNAIIADICKGIDSALPKVAIDQLSNHPHAYACEASRKDAIHKTLFCLEKGDLLIVAGKGHETTMEVQGRKFPFSDSAVISEYANAHWRNA